MPGLERIEVESDFAIAGSAPMEAAKEEATVLPMLDFQIPSPLVDGRAFLAYFHLAHPVSKFSSFNKLFMRQTRRVQGET